MADLGLDPLYLAGICLVVIVVLLIAAALIWLLYMAFRGCAEEVAGNFHSLDFMQPQVHQPHLGSTDHWLLVPPPGEGPPRLYTNFNQDQLKWLVEEEVWRWDPTPSQIKYKWEAAAPKLAPIYLHPDPNKGPCMVGEWGRLGKEALCYAHHGLIQEGKPGSWTILHWWCPRHELQVEGKIQPPGFDLYLYHLETDDDIICAFPHGEEVGYLVYQAANGARRQDFEAIRDFRRGWITTPSSEGELGYGYLSFPSFAPKRPEGDTSSARLAYPSKGISLPAQLTRLEGVPIP
jgi:hypothetical protein